MYWAEWVGDDGDTISTDGTHDDVVEWIEEEINGKANDDEVLAEKVARELDNLDLGQEITINCPCGILYLGRE